MPGPIYIAMRNNVIASGPLDRESDQNVEIWQEYNIAICIKTIDRGSYLLRLLYAIEGRPNKFIDAI